MEKYTVRAQVKTNEYGDVEGLFIPSWVTERTALLEVDYPEDSAAADAVYAWTTDDSQAVAALENALQSASGVVEYNTDEIAEEEHDY